MIQKFRKKPVVIEAVQFNGMNAVEVCLFTNQQSSPTDDSLGHSRWTEKKLRIPTLEGVMIANYNDYIIKGVNGEFYPCKPDIFAKTYEPAEQPAQPAPTSEIEKHIRAFFGYSPKSDFDTDLRDYLASPSSPTRKESNPASGQ